MDNREYGDLVAEIRRELPNIVFPSMGKFDEVGSIEINSKDFIVVNENVEEDE